MKVNLMRRQASKGLAGPEQEGTGSPTMSEHLMNSGSGQEYEHVKSSKFLPPRDSDYISDLKTRTTSSRLNSAFGHEHFMNLRARKDISDLQTMIKRLNLE